MRYLIAILILTAGCCPKITEQVTIQRDTTTVYSRDTITIPEIREVFATNIKTLCDSINALSNNKTKIAYKIKGSTNANANLTILVDTSYKAELIATISNYEYIADSLRQVIKIKESLETTHVVNVCDNKLHIFSVWMLFLVVCLVALYVVTRR